MSRKDIVEGDRLRMELINKLKKENAFWSFDPSSLSAIQDEVLIEKTLLHLDIDEVKSLFLLFPQSKIKALWKEKMLSQEPMYHQLNRLYAFLFFNLKDPDRYIRNYVNNKHRSIQCMD